MYEGWKEGSLRRYCSVHDVESIALNSGRWVILIGNDEFDDDCSGRAADIDQVLFDDDRDELSSKREALNHEQYIVSTA